MKKEKNELEITDIQIFPVSSSCRLVARAKITINDVLRLTGLRIYNGVGGLFVSYPVTSNDDNDFTQIYYPVEKKFREYIEKTVLLKYNEVVVNFVSDKEK